LFNTYYLDQHKLILTSCSAMNFLSPSEVSTLPPSLASTMLLNSESGRKILAAHYQNFINIAGKLKVPLILTSPTWQANREALAAAGISNNINALAVRFLKYLRADSNVLTENIHIAGLVGSKHDRTRPNLALSSRESVDFHQWQIEQFENEGVDLLLASSMPALSEAVGIATAMAFTTTPYIISFMINREGRLLDGTSLLEAIDTIDSLGVKKPVGYMINNASPYILNAAEQPALVMKRLIGLQGCPATCCDSANPLQTEDIETWNQQTITLNRQYDLKILEGVNCHCPNNLENLAGRITALPTSSISP